MGVNALRVMVIFTPTLALPHQGGGNRFFCTVGLFIAAWWSVSAGAADAQGYPAKPLRMLVGFPAGSSLDTAARIVGGKLSELLRQNVIIDNRAGAAGNIATEIAARARPDGYTLLMGANGALAINPALYAKLPFDTVKDLAPISKIVDTANILVINVLSSANSVEQLIALARTGALLGGSSGVGSPGHLALELFNMMAGTKIVHVAYKASAPALLDVMGGNIHLTFATAATAAPLIKAGKLKGLGVTALKRSTLLPELPTISETGLAGFEVTGWYGVLAPAGTPRPLINQLNAAIVTALNLPDVRQSMLAQGFDISPGTPEEFGAFIRAEIAKWGKVVKFSGAKAN